MGWFCQIWVGMGNGGLGEEYMDGREGEMM